MKQTVLWNVLEYLCRLLGLSTGAGPNISPIIRLFSSRNRSHFLDIRLQMSFPGSPRLTTTTVGKIAIQLLMLLGVGIDTLLQGQFQSLALYLLISGMAVSLWEVSFLASLLFISCFAPRRGSTMDACWLRAKRRGAFQKFLAYALLSVACFLSPVHIWQVVFPGTLLILTSLAYFLLSKQRKEDTGNGAPEQSGDPGDGVIDEMAEDGSRQTPSSHRRFSSLARSLRGFFHVCQRPMAFLASSGVRSVRKPLDPEEQVEETALPLRGGPEGLAKESTSETALILSAQV